VSERRLDLGDLLDRFVGHWLARVHQDRTQQTAARQLHQLGQAGLRIELLKLRVVVGGDLLGLDLLGRRDANALTKQALGRGPTPRLDELVVVDEQ
jgi:hypothetical protein